MTNAAKIKKANDKIPKDELFLAKLIQNAASRGMKSCEGAAFMTVRTTDGPRKFCCAVGAASLELDTNTSLGCESWYFWMIKGNDLDEWTSTDGDAGESLGWAFREALRF